jgi:hypothetical protein
MIDEKVELLSDRPVLEQILSIHELTYKDLSDKLGISDSALRRVRSGNMAFRLTMKQIKVFSELLKPFGTRLEDLPDDWILEKKEIVTK